MNKLTNYHKVEQLVFDHLAERHENDYDFTFSVRKNAKKNALRDIFIGVENRKYFKFTLWDIPVAFPGSSGDLIDYLIILKKGARLALEAIMTKSPDEGQNQIDLEFVRQLGERLKSESYSKYQIDIWDEGRKNFKFLFSPKKNNFTDANELLNALDQLIDYTKPIVNEEIVKLKEKYPDWKAELISTDDFDNMISKLNERLADNSNDTDTDEIVGEDNDVQPEYRKTNPKEIPPLNQILYGPPGTGKTYQTKSLAVELIYGVLPNDRAEIKKKYNELVNQQRVKFITFHQSTAYEDFLEGIKPKLNEGDEEEDGDLKYNIEDGIFKKICIQAAYEYIKFQNGRQAAARTLSFSQLFDQLSTNFQQQLEEGKEVKIPLRSGNNINVIDISSQGNFILRHKGGERTYTVSKSRTEKLYNEIEDFDDIPNIYAYFRSIIGGSNASAYWAILNQINRLSQEPQSQEEVPISYGDKRIAFSRINWDQVSTNESVPKYLLIIDEINRGNIAAILGELITLLEEDKRGGNSESLDVILPYSKTKFSVPPNLYIIGTMNTADRSVEALDTALRRRFSFIEVAPKPELLSKIQIEGVDLEKLLATINLRIRRLLDKDHMIGHSYFLKNDNAKLTLQQLKSIFQNHILPLLQEYFYGNFGKIQLVLGKGFVEKVDGEGQISFADSDYDGEDYSDRPIYEVKNVSEMEDEEFINAVQQIYLTDEASQ